MVLTSKNCGMNTFYYFIYLLFILLVVMQFTNPSVIDPSSSDEIVLDVSRHLQTSLTATYRWQDAIQNYTVPSNVPPNTAMSIEARGAEGGGAQNGGLGGAVSVIVPVNPGQIFFVSIGKQGIDCSPTVTSSPTSMKTFCPACYGGACGIDGAFSGGGATTVWSPEASFTIIAGGGGGAGTNVDCYSGGSGGGSVGGSPDLCPAGTATGGTQLSGGTGLNSGSRNKGGLAGNNGGGGGAGFFGGGSGALGWAGAGGSSYISGGVVTTVFNKQGVGFGDGQAKFTIPQPFATPAPVIIPTYAPSQIPSASPSLLPTPLPSSSASPTLSTVPLVTTFTYTGNRQHFTVPAVPPNTEMLIEVSGASGGNFFFQNFGGGLGGTITVRLPVNEGDDFTLVLGQAGTMSTSPTIGGGAGGYAISPGAGAGGGATFVTGGNSVNIIAGGGGGAGSWQNGGGLVGKPGGGDGHGPLSTTQAGLQGTTTCYGFGGGGGGGYLGGAGGDCGGSGSGGSSYAGGDNVIIVNNLSGTNQGNGLVVFTILRPYQTPAPVAEPTRAPTLVPSAVPTLQPTLPIPTPAPTLAPTSTPTISLPPSCVPTYSPTFSPTCSPTQSPSNLISIASSSIPTPYTSSILLMPPSDSPVSQPPTISPTPVPLQSVNLLDYHTFYNMPSQKQAMVINFKLKFFVGAYTIFFVCLFIFVLVWRCIGLGQKYQRGLKDKALRFFLESIVPQTQKKKITIAIDLPRYMYRVEDLNERRWEMMESYKESRDSTPIHGSQGNETKTMSKSIDGVDKDNSPESHQEELFDIHLLQGSKYLGTGAVFTDYIFYVLNNHSLFSCVYCYERSSYSRLGRSIIFISQHALLFVFVTLSNSWLEQFAPNDTIGKYINVVFNGIVIAPLAKLYNRRARALLMRTKWLQAISAATALVLLFFCLSAAAITSAAPEPNFFVLVYISRVQIQGVVLELLSDLLAFNPFLHFSIYFNNDTINRIWSIDQLDDTTDCRKVRSEPLIAFTMGEYYAECLMVNKMKRNVDFVNWSGTRLGGIIRTDLLISYELASKWGWVEAKPHTHTQSTRIDDDRMLSDLTNSNLEPKTHNSVFSRESTKNVLHDNADSITIEDGKDDDEDVEAKTTNSDSAQSQVIPRASQFAFDSIFRRSSIHIDNERNEEVFKIDQNLESMRAEKSRSSDTSSPAGDSLSSSAYLVGLASRLSSKVQPDGRNSSSNARWSSSSTSTSSSSKMSFFSNPLSNSAKTTKMASQQSRSISQHAHSASSNMKDSEEERPSAPSRSGSISSYILSGDETTFSSEEDAAIHYLRKKIIWENKSKEERFLANIAFWQTLARTQDSEAAMEAASNAISSSETDPSP